MMIIFLLSISLNTFASFLPEGEEAVNKNAFIMQEIPSEYLSIISQFKQIYEPKVALSGGELEILFDLKNSRVNAFASREENVWRITFLGGLIFHKKINPEAFTAILCHEMGHHLGGAPFKDPNNPEKSWVSVEGQSDYYASNICFKELFEYADNKQYLQGKAVSKTMELGCKEHTRDKVEYNLCLRSSLYSDRLGEFFGALGQTRRGRRGKTPQIDTPDSSVVTRTSIQHPNSQCRLDTFFQGSICEYFYLQIPGKLNCPLRSGNFSGSRPKCWFAENK